MVKDRVDRLERGDLVCITRYGNRWLHGDDTWFVVSGVEDTPGVIPIAPMFPDSVTLACVIPKFGNGILENSDAWSQVGDPPEHVLVAYTLWVLENR